jgi:uncharacterized surface protein with fasciclin (FAS1) repeats|tara:strand:- start:1142 stop:1939 length:798 start_codon:yes stop_codon:yes gene_type:complete
MPRFFRPTLTLLLVAALASCALGACAEETGMDARSLEQPTDPVVPGVATDVDASAEEKPKLPSVLAENDLEFATLLAAVQAAESGVIAEDLNSAGPFTVFAPNNEAFKTFFETSEITVAELLANPELGDILRRHVIKGRYTAADALALDLPIEVPTLDGENSVRIDKTVDGELLVGGVKVIAPDIEAANGIIHGMEGVIVDVVPNAEGAEGRTPEGEETPEEPVEGEKKPEEPVEGESAERDMPGKMPEVPVVPEVPEATDPETR